jgi:hypothetical protein
MFCVSEWALLAVFALTLAGMVWFALPESQQGEREMVPLVEIKINPAFELTQEWRTYCQTLGCTADLHKQVKELFTEDVRVFTTEEEGEECLHRASPYVREHKTPDPFILEPITVEHIALVTGHVNRTPTVEKELAHYQALQKLLQAKGVT